ncbi:hypothetical protein HZC34_03435 [Candidatus Saganbacteria bacterium]|nr:hypothetical protein [Candidatus Saganbacteria bacterium]
MKNNIIISLLVIGTCLPAGRFASLGFAVTLIAGCGTTQSTTAATTTTTTSSTTTTTIAGTTSSAVSIKGNIYSGAVRTSALSSLASGVRIMADPTAPLSGYTVVAVGTVDKKVYFPDTTTAATDGAFSISVPSGESFYLELIDSGKKFVAPVSFGGTATSVYMAITPESTGGPIDLGKIVYESAKGAAVPTAEIASTKLDTGSTATKKSTETFIPVGAGILGRGTGEAAFTGTLKDAVDEDSDGIPDVIDVDDDGDGSVDGLDSTPRKTGAVEVKVAGVSNTNAFSNLPLIYEEYPTYISGAVNSSSVSVGAKTNMAIEVVMATGYTANDFSEIRVIDGPAWIGTATISGDGPAGSSGTLWSANSYKLYKGTNNDRWTVHVIPVGTPEAGDIIKFRVTSTSGTTQEFISTINYVFHSIPRLTSYKYTTGGAYTTKEGSALNLNVYQLNSNKFTFEGTSVTFTWTVPRDDAGNPITGMNYNLDGINYYDATGAVLIQAGALRPAASTLISSSDATFGPTYTYIFTPTTAAYSYFKVDVKAESPANGGGNASQLIYFRKT